MAFHDGKRGSNGSSATRLCARVVNRHTGRAAPRHGAAQGTKSAALLRNGILKTYQGLPHGMPTTHADLINADLLSFLREGSE